MAKQANKRDEWRWQTLDGAFRFFVAPYFGSTADNPIRHINIATDTNTEFGVELNDAFRAARDCRNAGDAAHALHLSLEEIADRYGLPAVAF